MWENPGIVFLAVAWALGTALAVYWLARYRELSDAARAVWVLVILIFPYLGAAVALLATMDKRKRSH